MHRNKTIYICRTTKEGISWFICYAQYRPYYNKHTIYCIVLICQKAISLKGNYLLLFAFLENTRNQHFDEAHIGSVYVLMRQTSNKHVCKTLPSAVSHSCYFHFIQKLLLDQEGLLVLILPTSNTVGVHVPKLKDKKKKSGSSKEKSLLLSVCFICRKGTSVFNVRGLGT